MDRGVDGAGAAHVCRRVAVGRAAHASASIEERRDR